MSILPTFCNSPALALAPLQDESSHGGSSSHEYRIVLYKERHIVIYNQKARRLEARLLTGRDEATLRSRRLAFCPMCGQTIDPLHFAFQAQAYFLLLQDVYRSHFREGTFASARTHEAASRSTFSTSETTGRDAGSGASVDGEGLRFGGDGGHSEQRGRILRARTDSSSYSEGTSGSQSLQRTGPRPLPPQNASQTQWPLADAEHSSEEEGGSSREGKDPGQRVPKSAAGTEAPDNTFPEPQHLPKAMFATGYYFSFFREIRKLGSGSFGQVFLCHHVLDDLFLGEYAIKKVPVGDDKAWLRKMLREVKIRERLHHANIVEYKHSWLEMHAGQPHLPIIPWLFVLMECCNAGDLETYLIANNFYQPTQVPPDPYDTGLPRKRRERQFLDESHIWKFFFDVANGLNHLHHSGILHRDLKPSNILLHCTLDTLTGKPTTAAMLSDFGTSELFGEPEKRMGRQGFTGTVEYTAPELLETDQEGNYKEDYDEKSDLWSLGVVMHLLAFGYLPFTSDEPASCRQKILEAPYFNFTAPPGCPLRSTDLLQLIEALLQRDPSLRPSLDEVLFHRRIYRRATDIEAMTKAGEEIAFTFVRGPKETSTAMRTHGMSTSEEGLNNNTTMQLPDISRQ